jgi:hypothetical protein
MHDFERVWLPLLGPNGGETHSLAGEEVRGPNSDDWTVTLILYIVIPFTKNVTFLLLLILQPPPPPLSKPCTKRVVGEGGDESTRCGISHYLPMFLTAAISTKQTGLAPPPLPPHTFGISVCCTSRYSDRPSTCLNGQQHEIPGFKPSGKY